MTDRQFRRARPDEFTLLDEMTLAGVRHWGHDEKFPEAYNGLVAEIEGDEGAGDATIFVIDEGGEVVAFYDLRDRGDHVELLRMFQKPELIGSGYGRLLWDHCIAEAANHGDRMLIMSDPGAIGFYEAMGAELEKKVEVVTGFSLGVLWYDVG